MVVVLITGMSGAGKSTALAALAARGHETVDTDVIGWIEPVDGEPCWREHRMQELLDRQRTGPLFIGGTVVNQGRFRDRFDAVVLLTAPPEVLLERIRLRTTNDFGKSDVERAAVLEDHRAVEPRIRATATHVIDTTAPLADVVAALERLVAPASSVGGTAEAWIDALGLVPLPDESGWWAERSVSAIEVALEDRRLPASSSIHYLLDSRRPVNVWHRLESDDTHVLIDGGPVEYVVWPEGLAPFRAVLGRDHAAGQMPVVVAPGGSWKALRLLEPAGFALMATVVTPAWTPDRVRVGLPPEDAERLLALAPWLDRESVERLGRP